MLKSRSKDKKLPKCIFTGLCRRLRLHLGDFGHNLAYLAVNGAGLGFLHIVGESGIGENLALLALQLLELAFQGFELVGRIRGSSATGFGHEAAERGGGVLFALGVFAFFGGGGRLLRRFGFG